MNFDICFAFLYLITENNLPTHTVSITYYTYVQYHQMQYSSIKRNGAQVLIVKHWYSFIFFGIPLLWPSVREVFQPDAVAFVRIGYTTLTILHIHRWSRHKRINRRENVVFCRVRSHHRLSSGCPGPFFGAVSKLPRDGRLWCKQGTYRIRFVQYIVALTAEFIVEIKTCFCAYTSKYVNCHKQCCVKNKWNLRPGR